MDTVSIQEKALVFNSSQFDVGKMIFEYILMFDDKSRANQEGWVMVWSKFYVI